MAEAAATEAATAAAGGGSSPDAAVDTFVRVNEAMERVTALLAPYMDVTRSTAEERAAARQAYRSGDGVSVLELPEVAAAMGDFQQVLQRIVEEGDAAANTTDAQQEAAFAASIQAQLVAAGAALEPPRL